MLLEVFECKHPVDLVPQKGNGKLGLADIQTNVELNETKFGLEVDTRKVH